MQEIKPADLWCGSWCPHTAVVSREEDGCPEKNFNSKRKNSNSERKNLNSEEGFQL